ncbi:MAG: DMT family transporter [Bacteroidetes bacterium]|nr:DMT family transporter [Bacteroidota bacterium]
MSYTFIFLSILSFSLSNCLWIYPLRRLSFLQVIVLRSFLTSVLFATLWFTIYFGWLPDFGGVDSTVSLALEIVYAILLCIFSFFGLYFYVRSLKVEKVSIAVPVSSISAFFGVATAIVYLGEPVHTSFFMVLILLTAGVMLINNKPIKRFRFTKGVRYNLYAALFWGVSFALFVFPVKALGAVLFSFILEVVVCTCSLILLRRENKAWSFPLAQIDKYIVVLAFLGFGGIIFYNLSLLCLPVSTISLLSTITPALSVVMASVLFKEKLNSKQYAGLLIILAGLFLLRLF